MEVEQWTASRAVEWLVAAGSNAGGQRVLYRGAESGYSCRSTGVAEGESVAESGRGSSSVGVAAMGGQL